MLRPLREQRWYTLLWLPLGTATGLLAFWLLIMFRTMSIWTNHYQASYKWGFASLGVFALFLFIVMALFPRRPAWRFKVFLTSVGLVAVALGALVYGNTRVLTYEVRDVDGGPLENIPIEVTHHADGVGTSWIEGGTVIRTNGHGIASVRIFKCEECQANINVLPGEGSGHGNAGFSDELVIFLPDGLPWSDHVPAFLGRDLIEHSYQLRSTDNLLSIWQGDLELAPAGRAKVIRVYLCRDGSPSRPPYLNNLIGAPHLDDSSQAALIMSLGGSIDGFNHADRLFSALSQTDEAPFATWYGLNKFADQINEISRHLPDLSLDPDAPQSRYRPTNEERQVCSLLLYRWINGHSALPALTHEERLISIKQRMDEATSQLIEALHPFMLKSKGAFGVLSNLGPAARPALKFYPEVFDKGMAEAREGALETIGPIAPSARDIAFLLKSKNPIWIDCFLRITLNSTAKELADDLQTLQSLRAQETDPANLAALDRVIPQISGQLKRDQADEANKPASKIEPRYVVIDLGPELQHPLKITNSGYILGSSRGLKSVWFDGKVTSLDPKNAGDTVTIDDIDESGTVTGWESNAKTPRSMYRTRWQPGAHLPELSDAPLNVPSGAKAVSQRDWSSVSLPQKANMPVTPQAVNAAVSLLPPRDGVPGNTPQLVPNTQVIGNGPGGAYLWDITPTRSPTKVFEGPFLLSSLLPGLPKYSPWKIVSAADLNDGGSIVGTAIYKPQSTADPIAAGAHGVLVMPLAIVREAGRGSGDLEPIVDNGLDDNATVPIFTSAPPGTAGASDPESDGQGIFYIQMAGTVQTSIALKCGSNRVTVQATPVKGWPNLLRTGKLVLIGAGDRFRAADITTIEAGGPGDGNSLELQKGDQTIVR